MALNEEDGETLPVVKNLALKTRKEESSSEDEADDDEKEEDPFELIAKGLA